VSISSKKNGEKDFVVDESMNIDELLDLVSSQMNGLLFNANKALLGQKVPMPHLNESGEVIFDKEEDYPKIIAQNTTTNLKAINIGTEASPKYIYTVQRNVELEQPTIKKGVHKPVEQLKVEIATEAPTIELDTQMSDFADYSTDEYDLSFSPAEVTDKNLEKLVEPTNNLESSGVEFLRDLSKEQVRSFKKNSDKLIMKCKK
jgi:hypothetical protein